jgi:nicotinamide-nucleotide amidase
MDNLEALAQQVGSLLLARGETVCCAESCTGGLISAALTEIAGSSSWFGYGFVSYANQAKEGMLGVSADTLQREGAVSEAVVREMTRGALARTDADWALAVSGIAGPSGGSRAKPVGTVWFSLASRAGHSEAFVLLFSGDRSQVRQQTVATALRRLAQLLAQSSLSA